MSSRSNLKLATGEAPLRTLEREQLASAIERHATVLDSIRRVSQAGEDATETVFRASDALKAAEAKLNEAKAGEAAYLAAVALGEDGGVSVADAEAAVTQAANDLGIARRTRDALDERSKRETAEVERAREAIDKRIGAVVKSEADVEKLLAEAQAAQADLVAKRVQLRHLFNNGLVGEQEHQAVRQFLLFEHHLPVGRGQAEYGNGHYDEHPANNPWRAAIAALRENADAPLPA